MHRPIGQTETDTAQPPVTLKDAPASASSSKLSSSGMLQVLQEPRTVFPGAPPIPHGAQPVLNGSQLTLRVAHPFVKDAPHNAQPVHKVTKIILHGAQPVAQDAQPVLQGFQPVPQDAQPMLQEALTVLKGTRLTLHSDQPVHIAFPSLTFSREMRLN